MHRVSKAFLQKKLQYSKSLPHESLPGKNFSCSCKEAVFITSNGLNLLPTTRGSYLRQDDLPKTWTSQRSERYLLKPALCAIP